MTNEEYLTLASQAKECQANKEQNPKLLENLYATISTLDSKDQDDFISKFRDKSIAVWGQAPQTHTGYGVARDAYSKVLTERLIDASMTRTQIIQNGQGAYDKAKNIEKAVIGKMTNLPEDLFTSLSSTISSYEVPKENKGIALSQDAINRISYGLKQVKDYLLKAQDKRAKIAESEESTM